MSSVITADHDHNEHVPPKTIGDLTAVILAGGFGTRLKPVVSDVPKILAPIGGRPFVEILFDKLIKVGIKKVVLCTGYMADKVEARLGDHYKSITIAYSKETTPLGTAGALRKAAHLIHRDTVLALNGDSLVEANLPAFFSWHKKQPGQGSLLLIEVPDVSRYGAVEIDVQSHQVRHFLEKSAVSGAGLVSAGVYLLKRNLILSIPEGRAVSIETEMFPLWVKAGWLYGYAAKTSTFLDIGTPESFRDANDKWGENS